MAASETRRVDSQCRGPRRGRSTRPINWRTLVRWFDSAPRAIRFTLILAVSVTVMVATALMLHSL